MSDVLQRLETIRNSYSEAQVQKLSLKDLENLKVSFGKAHLGKTYLQVWNEEQKWLMWFLRTYGESPKACHQTLVHYARLKTCELEEDLAFDPKLICHHPVVTCAQSPVTPKPKSSMVKGASSSEIKEESWEMAESQAETVGELAMEMQTLSSRMDQMEMVIQQILVSVQAMAPGP